MKDAGIIISKTKDAIERLNGTALASTFNNLPIQARTVETNQVQNTISSFEKLALIT